MFIEPAMSLMKGSVLVLIHVVQAPQCISCRLLSKFWSVSHLPPGRHPQTRLPYRYVHAQRRRDGDVGTEPSPVPRCPTYPSCAVGTYSWEDGGLQPGPVPAGHHCGGAGITGGLDGVLQVSPELQTKCDCQTGARAGPVLPRNTIFSPEDWQNNRWRVWKKEEE